MSGDQNQYQRDQENVSYMYTMPPQEILSHTHLSFYLPPPTVGYWVVPNGDPIAGYTKFPTYSVPRWHHRYFMNLIFGWKWEGA